ncbi:MAG: HlyD family efflux transporter periplasmic adaptor subunit, partial [Prolixibacteraceae bacterium]|nr:HlyD family efflux transporter periplasmic adaptor subunit [Prolixibacteraceae bacterium]
GEIRGKNSVLIKLPDDFKSRDLRIRELQIKDLVQEGTLVKKGDWIATLDIASITNQIQDNNNDIEEDLADFEDAKIDSAIELNNFREEIKEFRYDLEYQTLELEQAKFESLAYQRKAKVAYNKIIRQMDAKLRNFERKKIELKVRVRRSEREYMYRLRRDSLLKKAIEQATITAPQDGLVMYAKVRGGRKIRVGDNISPWNPTIASLPDMSVLVSETYIEEIDITKIAINDNVEIVVDALPDQEFSGFVSGIANIGQELSGFESKVFQVIIELNQTNPELKPAMTTNNNIIINNISDVLTIPRQCLYSENGNDFVYIKRSGKIWKKIVSPGIENENEIVIESGLEEKDRILYSQPEKAEIIDFFDK